MKLAHSLSIWSPRSREATSISTLLPSNALDTAAQNASHSTFLIARAVMAWLSIAEFKPKTNSPPDCSKQSSQNDLSEPPASGDRMINHEHHDRADDGNEHRIKIETGDPHASDAGKDETADAGADDAEHDVQNAAFALPIDDAAGDEAGDQAEQDPADKAHREAPETVGLRWVRP